MKRLIASAAALALLSSCADLSSHVSGSFACGAPQGTCAPTMAIDDGALAKIVQASIGETPKRAASADVAPSPASEPHTFPAHQAHIVFPGYTDARGQRHDPAGVYVMLYDARFADTSVTGGAEAPANVAGFVPARTNLVAAASAQDAVDQQPVVPVPPSPAPAAVQTFPSSTVQN